MFTASFFYLLLPLVVTIMIGLTYFITDRIFCQCYRMQLRASQLQEFTKKKSELGKTYLNEGTSRPTIGTGGYGYGVGSDFWLVS